MVPHGDNSQHSGEHKQTQVALSINQAAYSVTIYANIREDVLTCEFWTKVKQTI